MKHSERLISSLEQICDAIDWILEHTETIKTFSALQANRTLQFAVERNFEIMGEAVNRIFTSSKEFIETHPQVPWDDMRRMRNKLIHNYDDVDVRIIWITIKSDLPNLRKHLTALLTDLENRK